MNSSRHVRADRWWSASAYALWIALWILLAVLMFLSLPGCSTPSVRVAVMDSRLTAPCERPALQGDTCRDVIRLAIEQDEALTDCADRINAIRNLTREDAD
jgi:hypothetical protein